MSDTPSKQSDKPKKTGTAQRKRARKLVLQALYQRHISEASMSQIEAEFRTDNDFEKVDSDYFSALFGGIPKEITELDRNIEPFLDRPIGEVDPIEINILRMGVYEFMYRVDVPYRVVINEAIELAKQFGGTDGHKYVNGILDKLSLRLRAPETRSPRS